MTNPRIDLPSQRKYWDITAIEGRQKPKNDLWQRFAFIMALGLILLGAWAIANPVAKAKTIELRDCRTNAECLQIYCSGEAVNYVQDKSICHD